MDGDVKKGNSQFNPKQRLQAAIGCCKGVAELHQLGIIHRDVKLDNFLYKMDAEGNITAKINDMGKAVNIHDPQSITSTSRTWAIKYLIPDFRLDSNAWLTKQARDDFVLVPSLLQLFSPDVPFPVAINHNNEIDVNATWKNQYNFVTNATHETAISPLQFIPH